MLRSNVPFSVREPSSGVNLTPRGLVSCFLLVSHKTHNLFCFLQVYSHLLQGPKSLISTDDEANLLDDTDHSRLISAKYILNYVDTKTSGLNSDSNLAITDSNIAELSNSTITFPNIKLGDNFTRLGIGSREIGGCTLIGWRSGFQMDWGAAGCVALGSQALMQSHGISKIGIGNSTGYNNRSSKSIYLGTKAGYVSDGSTTVGKEHCIYIGENAGQLSSGDVFKHLLNCLLPNIVSHLLSSTSTRDASK